MLIILLAHDCTPVRQAQQEKVILELAEDERCLTLGWNYSRPTCFYLICNIFVDNPFFRDEKSPNPAADHFSRRPEQNHITNCARAWRARHTTRPICLSVRPSSRAFFSRSHSGSEWEREHLFLVCPLFACSHSGAGFVYILRSQLNYSRPLIVLFSRAVDHPYGWKWTVFGLPSALFWNKTNATNPGFMRCALLAAEHCGELR
jgi:hypothetical protein